MPSSDEFDRALNELIEESNDRAVGIVAASLIEHSLEEAIVYRLLPMSNNHRRALFRSDDGYTFSSKIDLGLSLGLYGNKTNTDLHRIKKIRNEFAHNLDRDFRHENISRECDHLTDYRDGEPLSEEFLEKIGPLKTYLISREARWRYIFAVTHINLGLLKETLPESLLPKPRFLP